MTNSSGDASPPVERLIVQHWPGGLCFVSRAHLLTGTREIGVASDPGQTEGLTSVGRTLMTALNQCDGLDMVRVGKHSVFMRSVHVDLWPTSEIIASVTECFTRILGSVDVIVEHKTAESSLR